MYLRKWNTNTNVHTRVIQREILAGLTPIKGKQHFKIKTSNNTLENVIGKKLPDKMTRKLSKMAAELSGF